MKKTILRDRVARFIRRRRDDGYKPEAMLTELCRGALSLARIEDGSENGMPVNQIVVSKTEDDGVKVEMTHPDYAVELVPASDSSTIRDLTRAFGEMPVTPGDAYYVKIDDDGQGFSVEPVNGVSPQMTETALRHARDQFTYYRDQHAAKGTPDADEKAAVNQEMALLMSRALCESGLLDESHVKLGLLPIDKDAGGFKLAVENLVERGFELDTHTNDMMQALFHAAISIGRCAGQGWNRDTRIVIGFDEKDRTTFHIVAPGTPKGQEVAVRPSNPARERDSGLLAASDTPMDASEAVDRLRALADDTLCPDDVREIADTIEQAFMRGDVHLVAWLTRKARVAAKAGMTDTATVLTQIVESMRQGLVDQLPVDPVQAMRAFFADCHGRNVKAGWWSDLATGLPKKRSVGELFMLMVTELWEAYDAYVSSEPDDKLPQYPGVGVEIGDLLIRVADFCGALAAGSIVDNTDTRNPGDMMFQEVGAIATRYESIRKTEEAKGDPERGEPVPAMDVAEMIFAKLDFNAQRPDHKIENRLKADGKRT